MIWGETHRVSSNNSCRLFSLGNFILLVTENTEGSKYYYFLHYIIFYNVFMLVLCASFYLVAASVGYSGCVHGLLIVVASLAAEHSSRALKFQ